MRAAGARENSHHSLYSQHRRVNTIFFAEIRRRLTWNSNTTSKIGEDVGQVIQDLPSLQETAKGVSVLLNEVKDIKLMTTTLRYDLANLVQSLQALCSTTEPSESFLSSHGVLSSGDPTLIKADLEALQITLHNLTVS